MGTKRGGGKKGAFLPRDGDGGKAGPGAAASAIPTRATALPTSA